MFELIQTVTLASTTASITFSNIPQDGTDLFIILSSRSGDSDIRGTLEVSFNNSAAFTASSVYGNGSSTVRSNTNQDRFSFTSGNTTTANTFGNWSLYVSRYTATGTRSFHADFNGENNNATNATIGMAGGVWTNTTNAITQLRVTALGSFLAGTTASIYKITS